MCSMDAVLGGLQIIIQAIIALMDIALLLSTVRLADAISMLAHFPMAVRRMLARLLLCWFL